MILAIDLNGTSSKCAFINNKGKILLEFAIITAKVDILLNLKTNIDNILHKNNFAWKQITFIGIAVPGFFDVKSGIIKLAGNLNWYEYPFLKIVNMIFKKPIICINDAKATTFGDYYAQTSKKNNLMLFIGDINWWCYYFKWTFN